MSFGWGKTDWATIAFWTLVSLGVVALVISLISLAIGGIGWDSRNNTETGLAFSRVLPSTSLAEAYATIPSTAEFYGTLVQQLADVLFVLRGGATETGSNGRLASIDPWTYRYQGIVVIVMSFIAVTSMAVALAISLRSRLAGAFFWALTLSTPLWLGMTHVNFKDVPVAAGLTLFSAGLILAQVAPRGGKAIPAAIVIGAVGTSISLGTRPGSITLVLALGLGSLLIAMAHGRLFTGSFKPAVPLLVVVFPSLAVGTLVLLLTNPIARLGPKTWLIDTIATVSAYPWEGSIRTAGVDLSSLDLPLWYVPAWLVAQLPLLTLGALVVAGSVGGWYLLREPSLFRSPLVPALSPLLIQALVLPVAIVVTGSVLYDGIRHLLFMIPALFALISVVVAFLINRGTWSSLRLNTLLVLCVVIVFMSLFAATRWMPYSYAFVNPVAGAWNGAWELDYWGVSVREGTVRLNELGYERVRSLPWAEQGLPWGSEESTEKILSSRPTGAYVFRRTGVGAEDYGCKVLFEITRDGLLLGEGAECPPTSRKRTSD